MSEVGGGEAAGWWAAAVVPTFSALAVGFWRVITWRERRLRTWEESLDKAAARMRQEMAAEVQGLRREVIDLRGAMFDVVVELETLNPQSLALRRAKRLLTGAFHIDPEVPADMAAMAAKLDR